MFFWYVLFSPSLMEPMSLFSSVICHPAFDIRSRTDLASTVSTILVSIFILCFIFSLHIQLYSINSYSMTTICSANPRSIPDFGSICSDTHYNSLVYSDHDLSQMCVFHRTPFNCFVVYFPCLIEGF